MRDLDALLSPRSIAVVGASEGARHGGEVMRALGASGYSGRIIPVNGRHAEVYGHRCIADLSSLDEPVDCVVIAVRREEVARQLSLAGAAGARAAVIVAGGFREAGADGAALEGELAETARRHGIRLLGPNTIGFINFHAGIACYAAAIPARTEPGSIAAAVQSGTVAGALGGAGRGLRLRHLVATGNEADVGIAELLGFFADDPGTRVILLFIESLTDPEGFRASAERARAEGKPVVVLRAGNSAAGRRITSAHTGALADDPRAFAAFARRCGLIVVRSMNELIVTGELLAALAERPCQAGGLAVMTHSGGEAAVFVDLAAAAGFTLPALSPASVKRLRGVFPAYHVPGNPLDITGLGATDRDVFKACLEALCDDPAIGIVGVMQDIRAGHWVLRQAAEVTAEVAARTMKPIVFFSNTTRHVEPEMDALLTESGVPVLYGTREVVGAVAAALSLRDRAGDTEEEPVQPGAAPDGEVVRAAASAGGWSADLLALAGVEGVATRIVPDAASAIGAAREIGFPVVVKAQKAGLEHKTEAGAVRLGIRDEAMLREALAGLSGAVPYADALLVQRMVESPVAELILGIQRDPVYGWTVLVGAGGTMTEILDDVSVRIAPLSEGEAEAMLRELRLFPLLDGFRGRPAGDIAAAAAAVSGLSRLAPRLEGVLAGVEINPLAVLARGEGAVALDLLASHAGGS